MPADAAIPLACLVPPNTVNIGSGFLARYKGVVALVSAAHTPTRSAPTTNWSEWPPEMIVFPAPDERLTTPLFTGDDAARSPTFRFMLAPHPGIADMMLLIGSIHQNVLSQLMTRYSVLELSQAGYTPRSGDMLTCYGFPHHHPQWPYTPPFSSSGPFICQSTGPMFEADIPAQVGQSGGPVFDASDQLVGMLIGSTDGVTRIVPNCTLAHLWP